MTFSAKGTRLNRRGLETRAHILDVALELLARGGPEVVSANSIAKEAGVTWGTIQHQFGDTDGVWAAVLVHAAHRSNETVPDMSAVPASVPRRVAAMVDALWDSMDTAPARAVVNLRMMLPSNPEALADAYPQTANTLKSFDQSWQRSWEVHFDGLVGSKTKLRRVRSLLPGAVRGLHSEAQLTNYTDVAEGRKGLVDAVTVYLS